MIVFEFKAKAKCNQYRKIDEGIRITQFIRNKCLRFWMDNSYVNPYDLNKYTTVLANEFDFADKLKSIARQAAASRTAFAIKRFFDNSKAKIPGKKGYPQLQESNRSLEYKTSGCKLSDDQKHITSTGKCGIGQLKLIGTWYLHFYQI